MRGEDHGEDTWEMRDVSKYFSDFSIRSITREARARRIGRAHVRTRALRFRRGERAADFDVSMTRTWRVR